MFNLIKRFLINEKAGEIPGWLMLMVFAALVIGGVYAILRPYIVSGMQNIGSAISGQ